MTMNNQTPEDVFGASLDISAENRARLKALFPQVFTETMNEQGELVDSVDFAKLQAELGTFTDVFESRRERYGLDWPGKKDCLKAIQTPTFATLKPSREESVNFDTTQNLFIEGDNLEVLKLLQKSYYGKVKMIYIDPPYNTGKDFIYPDNYSESLDTYLSYAGLTDEDGKRIESKKNAVDDGRFHTKWLSMMYPRLYLARNLLREDGAIFISIDDSEVNNLRKLCDEILGAENFRNSFVVRRHDKNLNRQFIESGLQTLNVGFEYVLCYSKTDYFSFNPVYREASEQRQNTGYWKGFWNAPDRPTMRYEILGFKPEEGQWKWKKEVAEEAIKNYQIYEKEFSENMTLEAYWESTGKSKKFIRRNPTGTGKNMGVENWIAPSDGILRNTNLLDILATKSTPENQGFDFPKNVDLIKIIANFALEKEDIILDFFAGSATTAHAVLELNQDGENRKFILVQLPEPCNQESEAFKAGFKTIADIGKERIRRVITKLNEDGNPDQQDRGFKSLKLNKSNFKKWQVLDKSATPEAIINQLDLHIDHINPNASPEDLLYEVLIKAGFTPTEKIEVLTLAGIDVYSIADSQLLICLAKKVSKELMDAVVAITPPQFICLDSAFEGNDQLKANAVQTFAAANQDRDKKNQIIFHTL